MKVLTVVGARPQFIKAATVSRALTAADGLEEVMVHTGQHFDDLLSDVFFRELEIPKPAYHFDIHGGHHGAMTGRMLAAVEEVLLAESPDVVLVYGDTNSTLAGALAAAKLGVPVAHVEAGLRSYNRGMPEEINRVLTDHLSARLYAPTSAAVEALRREGIEAGVRPVGDVMYDAAVHAVEQAKAASTVVERLGLDVGEYAVATVHRASNTDTREALAEVVGYLTDQADELPVVLPLHPRTAQAAAGLGVDLGGLLVTDPLSYFDMTRLLAGAAVVYTDSGGLQKEAYFHRVPCVTLRDETEWVETVDAGWNRLWRGPDYAARRDIDEYGDGHAAERIVADLAESLG